MSRALHVVALAATAILIAPTAHGADAPAPSGLSITNQAFRELCLANPASPEAQSARARAGGFVTPPAAFANAFPAAVADHPTLLWKTYEGGVVMLISGQINPAKNPMGKGIPGVLCAVANMPGDGDPVAGLQGLLGFAPNLSEGGRRLFLYREADGRMTPVDKRAAADYAAAVKAGGLREVTTQYDRRGPGGMPAAMDMMVAQTGS